MPRRRDPAKAALILDLLSEFFDNGRRWLQCGYHDDNGNRCLISAITHLRAVNVISGDGPAYYLREAQPQWIYMPIMRFNDACQSYDNDNIRALIDRARALAQAELDAADAAPQIKLAA